MLTRTEVAVDQSDGMPVSCVLSLDNLAPIRTALCTERITILSEDRMAAISEALGHAIRC